MRNKRAYSKPILESETFVPQEYVAKCQYKTSYKGKCDISGYVFTDTDMDGYYDEKTDPYKYKNTACRRTFETSEEPHLNAFIFPRREWIEGKKGGRGYYVGRGTMTRIFNFDNTHANENIDTTIHHNVS